MAVLIIEHDKRLKPATWVKSEISIKSDARLKPDYTGDQATLHSVVGFANTATECDLIDLGPLCRLIMYSLYVIHSCFIRIGYILVIYC